METETKQGLPILPFASVADWEAWLAEHHQSAPGVWIKYAKKGTGIPSVELGEALDVALCYGWIDGQRNSIDGTYYAQKYTPRRPKSKWSAINREKVAALIAQGRMQPAGLAAIDAAKADGRWDAAYASPSRIAVPPDLQAELEADPAAAAFFATLTSQNRYAILYRLHDAKRPETRARRLAQFMEMLRRGEKLYP